MHLLRPFRRISRALTGKGSPRARALRKTQLLVELVIAAEIIAIVLIGGRFLWSLKEWLDISTISVARYGLAAAGIVGIVALLLSLRARPGFAREYHELLFLKRLDLLLLACVILGKILLLAMRWNVPLGYDIEAFLTVLKNVSWHNLIPDFSESYYAYHMPLGFWLMRIAMSFNLPVVASVQVIGLLSTIGSVLLLRSTLKRLGILWKPVALFFLYFTASLPLVLYLETTVNLDMLIFFEACLLLRGTVGLALAETAWKRRKAAALIVATLVAALFTKYSALMLFPAVPLGVLCFAAKGPRVRLRAMGWGIIALVLAGLIALPGYYYRYKVPTGEWFYTTAGDTFNRNEVRDAQAARDKDPIGTLRRIALARPDGGRIVESQMWLVWMAWWMHVDRLPQSPFAAALYAWYSVIGWVIAIGGALLWVAGYAEGRWRSLGILLIAIALIYWLSQIYFGYRIAMPGYFATKGIYITPACLGVTYLISVFAEALFRKRFLMYCCLVFLTAWTLTNHLLPVY